MRVPNSNLSPVPAYKINLMNRSPRSTRWAMASHRVFNVLLSTAIILSLNSQAFAQKSSIVQNKKIAAGAAKTKKLKTSIDQQILAQANSLQGSTGARVKIYSDDTYKRKATKSKKTRNSVAQSGSATFGPSNTVDLDDSAPASSAKISTKMAEAKAEAAPANKLNGSVAITIGQDSNLDLDRTKVDGSFFEMKPGLSYEGSTFSGSFGAAIKDFSKQENSAIAKETKLNADIAAKFSISEDVSTKTKLGFVNSDVRWPDYIGGSDEGMPIRYFESKITQSLDFKLSALSIGINGSYSNRDFTNTYSDFAPEVLGKQEYQRDRNDAELNANIEAKFNDNLSFIAKPMLKHVKYKDEPARQTSGVKGGAGLNDQTPRAEVLTTELGVDLKMTFGPVTLTPTASVGQDADRALGALDTSYTNAGLTLEVLIDKDTGLKIGGSANYNNVKYDNWTKDLIDPVNEKREDKDLTTGISAGVNLSKSVALGVDYSYTKEKNNMVPEDATDDNYTREVIGSTITVSF